MPEDRPDVAADALALFYLEVDVLEDMKVAESLVDAFHANDGVATGIGSGSHRAAATRGVGR